MKEQCPKCKEIGKDNHKDNFERYPDGSGYCFSCKHYEPATRLSLPLKKKAMEQGSIVSITQAPSEEYSYLRKYLDISELEKWFSWSPKLGMYMFTYTSPEGQLYWEARRNYPDKKLTSSGEKPFNLMMPAIPEKHNSKVVVVEDIVSAIKVNRVFRALCLFGSNMPTEWMSKLARNPAIGEVVYWLDSDKAKEAIQYANKTAILGVKSRVLTTTYDPKEYSTMEITEWINM